MSRVLALHNLKGGVGKSTAAAQLAYHLACAGQATLLWDLDGQGAASWMFRVELAEEARPRRFLARPDELLAAIRGSDFPALDVLPADLSLGKLEQALAEEPEPERALAGALEGLRARYARIVLDCAPSLALLNRCVFEAADALLVPTLPTALSLRTLAVLHRHLKPHRRRGLAVLPFFSMVDARKALHREVCAYARREDLGFLSTEIPHSTLVESAAARRLPLAAVRPTAPAALAFASLTREVEEHLDARPETHGLRRARLEELLRDLAR